MARALTKGSFCLQSTNVTVSVNGKLTGLLGEANGITLIQEFGHSLPNDFQADFEIIIVGPMS